MIIRNQEDVTSAVLAELGRADDPRFREIMSTAVRHLHAFVREARLTEPEFQQACAVIAKLGQLTNASHNEVVLMAGSLGVSQLVCLQNNTDTAHPTTHQNLLGPFWRADSPRVANGGSLLRCPTPGLPMQVLARVVDPSGHAVAGAEVDIWHCAADGLYEKATRQWLKSSPSRLARGIWRAHSSNAKFGPALKVPRCRAMVSSQNAGRRWRCW